MQIRRKEFTLCDTILFFMKGVLQMKFQIHVPNEEAMLALGAQVSRYAEGGDFIALSGTLGMGKSTFARGFIRALAQDETLTVPSPTFTLVQQYEKTRLPLAHVDAYRIETPEDIYALGLEDVFEHGVVLMEWAEKGVGTIPEAEEPYRYPMESEFGSRLDITLKEGADGGRIVMFNAGGSWYQRMGLVLPEYARPVTEEGRRVFLESQGVTEEANSISPDCSFRTYYRLHTKEGSRILMDAPPPMENTQTFDRVATLLKQKGVRVPTLYGADHDKGYILTEDFGGTVLREAVQKGADAKDWLTVAVDLLVKWANEGAVSLPCAYGAGAVWQEACRYTDWYLPSITGHATAVEDRKTLQHLFYQVYPHIEKLPKGFTHWDFHVDNLMCLGEKPSAENLGVIDFQDARCGTIAFDLCCLLEDRFPADKATKEALIDYFLAGLDTKVDKEDFMAAYAISVTHRFLKITGLLERLERRDGRVNVKARMPQVWATLREATQHDVLSDIRAFLTELSPKEMKGN